MASTFVFVKHDSYERIGELYGDAEGGYGDNQFRFTLLSHAACEAPLVIDFGEGASANGFTGTYGDDVVFVANDWHAGSRAAAHRESKYRTHGTYKNARTVAAIHNILHQGVEPHVTFGNLGVPGDWYACLEYQFPEHMRAHELDLGLVVNILKGAIATRRPRADGFRGVRARDHHAARGQGPGGYAGGARAPAGRRGERYRHGRVEPLRGRAHRGALRRLRLGGEDGVQARAAARDGPGGARRRASSRVHRAARLAERTGFDPRLHRGHDERGRAGDHARLRARGARAVHAVGGVGVPRQVPRVGRFLGADGAPDHGGVRHLC